MRQRLLPVKCPLCSYSSLDDKDFAGHVYASHTPFLGLSRWADCLCGWGVENRYFIVADLVRHLSEQPDPNEHLLTYDTLNRMGRAARP